MRTGVGLALLLSTRVVLAADAPVKIAVMPVQVDKSAENQLPHLVNDIVLTAVQNIGSYEVIGQDDVNALIGFEQQKDLLGCDDASCLADIGGALGVDKIVVLKVARVGEEWVTTSKLINIREARVEARSSDFTPGGTKQLLVAMPQIIAKLFGSAAQAPAPAPAPTAAATQPSPEPTPAASAPVAPAPAPAATTPDANDRRGRGLFLGLSAAGAAGGSLKESGGTGSTAFDDTYDLDSAGAARLYAEYWFNRYVGAGLSYTHVIATPSCTSGATCDDSNWNAFVASVSGAFHPTRNLKLYGRLGLGSAKEEVLGSEQDLIDAGIITSDHWVGLFVETGVGALWQFARHFGVLLEVSRVSANATIEVTDTASGTTLELKHKLGATMVGLGAFAAF